MEGVEKEIEKIKGYKTWSVKRKIDKLLQMDATMYTNLGSDSTASERKKVKSLSKKIYKAIQHISPTEGFLLRAHMDEVHINSDA